MGDWSYLVGAIVGLAGYWFGAWLYYKISDIAPKSWHEIQINEIVRRLNAIDRRIDEARKP